MAHGGTLIFSYICRLWLFFWGGGVKNFGFQYCLGFSKNEYFWGMKILWIYFLVHHKIELNNGVFLCIVGSFLKIKVQNGVYFWVLEIPDIFF